MGFFSKLKSRGKTATREAALRKRITVANVERELPIFAFRNPNKILRTEVCPCVKYSLSRRSGAEPTNWQFLQRTTKDGAQYPNGWLFQAQQAPSNELHRVLEKIATEWNGELLEFEGTESEVSAYWEEWGGPELVEIINQYLLSLTEAGPGER
jgi:hypothetical protein